MSTTRLISLIFMIAFQLYALWTPQPCDAKPQVSRIINFGRHGAKTVRFGDLLGDSQAEIVTVQSVGQHISNVAAFSLSGELLWNIGRPNLKNSTVSADLPIQVFDWDGDDKAEIILVRNGFLEVRKGNSGKLLLKAPIPHKSAKDALFIIPDDDGKTINRLVLKNRENSFWMYSKNLRPLWSRHTNTGHFPLYVNHPEFPMNALLVGYTLFSLAGERLWSIPSYGDHNDASDIGDLNGNGEPEIAIATSKSSVLVTMSGDVLWSLDHSHSQHAVIGHFLWDRPEEAQAVFVDRGNRGEVTFVDYDGDVVIKLPPQGALTMISTVEGWEENKNRDLLLLSRTADGHPKLIDGLGVEIARFPFQPARQIQTKKKRRKKKKLNNQINKGLAQFDELSKAAQYAQTYVQHFDILGDWREEIILYDFEKMYIYVNDSPLETDAPDSSPHGLPNPRIYNASFYSGFQ